MRSHKLLTSPPITHKDFEFDLHEGKKSFLYSKEVEDRTKEGYYDYGIIRLAYLGRLIEPGINGYHFVIKGGNKRVWEQLEKNITKVEEHLFKAELVMWYWITEKRLNEKS